MSQAIQPVNIAPHVAAYAPAAVAVQCPLCGRSLIGKKPKLLNGVPICNKCRNAFANRRQFAWIIDHLIFYFISFIAGMLLGLLLMSSRSSNVPSVSTSPASGFDFTPLIVGHVLWLGFLLKDGFSGRSPGKMVCGIRTIDVSSHKPISFGQSFKRNLPTYIPFAILIMAVQLIKGTRWGDRWANTRVVWIRYQHCLPFDQRGLLCRKCGYDLTGNVSGRCPECGTDIPGAPMVLAVTPPFDDARASVPVR